MLSERVQNMLTRWGETNNKEEFISLGLQLFPTYTPEKLSEMFNQKKMLLQGQELNPKVANDLNNNDINETEAIRKKPRNSYGRIRLGFPKNWNNIYALWEEKRIKTKEACTLLNISKRTFYRLVRKHETEYLLERLVNSWNDCKEYEEKIEDMKNAWSLDNLRNKRRSLKRVEAYHYLTGLTITRSVSRLPNGHSINRKLLRCRNEEDVLNLIFSHREANYIMKQALEEESFDIMLIDNKGYFKHIIEAMQKVIDHIDFETFTSQERDSSQEWVDLFEIAQKLDEMVLMEIELPDCNSTS